ncbi:iron dicitrate transport regulator FecR [Sphingomonas sp. Leaf407]|uniref:SIS domain-containing protein n=1 Tax=unclassified Sphingomonas TaxID=196159 RepID=UPI0006F3B951|nr:iron dicitrate transport regulator FecR [Sphingomonas sp. Leaf42]KQT27161.1 iron dicitrate transport regulator FecR [Sphingomonas sp. Leaf407]
MTSILSADPAQTAAHEPTAMHREAAEGGQAVARFLARNAQALADLGAQLRADPPALVVTCARGSSDHAATYGKYLIETLCGVPVASAAPSVASVYATRMERMNALVIAVSQSGRSPDLLRTVESYKAAGARVVALVNVEDAPLAALADVVLPLSAGAETSVAATKSFIASLAGLAAVAAHWSEDRALLDALDAAPAQLEQAFALDWSAVVDTLVAARNLFVIGRGYSFGIAQEAALKMKETSALHAEAFSSAEVRHGPMAIIDDGFPLLGFATSDEAGDDVRAAAAEFAGRGAAVHLADAASDDSHPPALRSHPAIEPILMIQSFYRMIETVSRRRGLNPDAPPHLRKVTETR